MSDKNYIIQNCILCGECACIDVIVYVCNSVYYSNMFHGAPFGSTSKTHFVRFSTMPVLVYSLIHSLKIGIRCWSES